MAKSDIFIIPQDPTTSDRVVVVTDEQRESGFQFDAVEKYRTRRTYRPTKHSVPAGTPITDHVTRDPVMFALVGVITPYNTVSVVNPALALENDPDFTSLLDLLNESAATAIELVRKNRDQLVEFGDNFTLLTIIGDEFQHANMIITSVDDPRTPKLGDAYKLTVSFRQIKIPKQAARIEPLVAPDALRLGAGATAEVVF